MENASQVHVTLMNSDPVTLIANVMDENSVGIGDRDGVIIHPRADPPGFLQKVCDRLPTDGKARLSLSVRDFPGREPPGVRYDSQELLLAALSAIVREPLE